MMRAAYTGGRSHTKGTGCVPPFSKLSDKYFKNRDTPMTAVKITALRSEICRNLRRMETDMVEHQGEMQQIMEVEGSAFCAVRDNLGQLLSGEKSVYGSLVEVASPLRKLLLKSLEGNFQRSFDFFANLYDELSVTRLNCKVACIPFEREVQPVLYYAMGKGVYFYDDDDGPDDFYTTNREAVLVMSCMRNAHPRLFTENNVPMVRLAASEEERTKSVGNVKRLFESIGAAFGMREYVSEKIVVSCEDRVTILGWLRELEVLDPQNDTRILMEVCGTDGYLREFERQSGGDRALVTDSDFALQMDPVTGRGVNSKCFHKDEMESDFCICWLCCHGRGFTFRDQIDVGAKVFRMVRFFSLICFFKLSAWS